MPVTPHQIPGFVIKPPSTVTDNGAPSASVTKDAQRVFALIEDERHLTAQALLHSVQQRCKDWERRHSHKHHRHHPHLNFFHGKKHKEKTGAKEKEAQEVENTIKLLSAKKAVIEKLENRCRIFRRAQHNLNENEEWTLASKHFGVKTYYRREEDDSLSVKLEGEMNDAPIFEQICVLKEVDLHYKWSPFCSSSMTIADLDKLDLVAWFLIGMPNFGLARDGCFRAIGCDNIQEDGSILLAAQGVQDIMPGAPPHEDTFLSEDPVIQQLEIPPVPTRRGSGRMTIRKFEAVILLNSPTSITTRVVANINPNMSFLPPSLLEFVMKHMAGVVLAKLQGAAKKAAHNPVANVHARKMRAEKQFYQDWLIPKFKGICDQKGWEMPPIPAFQLSHEELRQEKRLKSHGISRAETFNVDSLVLENGNVVENLSQVSSSARPRSDTDNMSDLSNTSGKLSVWSNPIASYLREVEQKTQQRKADQIADIRLKAAERLRPKSFSSDRQQRLEELKKAKARRQGQRIRIHQHSSIPEEPEEKVSLHQWFSQKLYGHDPRTRFFVVTLLVIMLFLMLHPEPFLKHLPYKFNSAQEPLWAFPLEDFCVALYILLCAIPHFLVCDVALVYAFDSLEIGFKTGHQMKLYYSEKVRFGAFMTSLGIVGASCLKAALKVWLRCFFWSASQASSFLDAQVTSPARAFVRDAGRYLPQGVFNVYAAYLSSVETPAVAAGKWATSLIHRYVIQSNFLGRKMESLFGAFVSACVGLAQASTAFAKDSVEAFEGKTTLASWRMEAFDAARMLFSYTAVFLLTVLVLFILTARTGARPPATRKAQERVGIANTKSDLSSMSGDSQSQGPSLPASSSTPHIVAIPEENGDDTVLDPSPQPAAPDSTSVEKVSIASSQRGRLRFRNKKPTSSLSENGEK